MARVLVVDGDEDVRNLVRHRAQQAGHRVATGDEAMDRLLDQTTDPADAAW